MSAFLYKPHTQFQPSVDMARCRASVHHEGRRGDFHQCRNKKKIERGGIGYCTAHDPERQKRVRPLTRFQLELLRNAVDVAARRVAKLLLEARDDDTLSELPPGKLPRKLNDALIVFERECEKFDAGLKVGR